MSYTTTIAISSHTSTGNCNVSLYTNVNAMNPRVKKYYLRFYLIIVRPYLKFGSENSRKADPESFPSGHEGRPRRFSGYSQGRLALGESHTRLPPS
jgi:hypothetical protein